MHSQGLRLRCQVARRRAAERRAEEEAAERLRAGRLPAHKRAIDFRITRIHETGLREPPPPSEGALERSLLLLGPLSPQEPSPEEAAALAQQCVPHSCGDPHCMHVVIQVPMQGG
jgi:hypothetical protein